MLDARHQLISRADAVAARICCGRCKTLISTARASDHSSGRPPARGCAVGTRPAVSLGAFVAAWKARHRNWLPGQATVGEKTMLRCLLPAARPPVPHSKQMPTSSDARAAADAASPPSDNPLLAPKPGRRTSATQIATKNPARPSAACSSVLAEVPGAARLLAGITRQALEVVQVGRHRCRRSAGSPPCPAGTMPPAVQDPSRTRRSGRAARRLETRPRSSSARQYDDSPRRQR